MVRDPPERQRHGREGQQHHQGEAPVHAQRHHRHDQHQRERAVEAGQHGLASGHLHRVDVVGGQGHQVARAARLKEARALQRQALVEPRAQLHAHAVGRRVQLEPPAHAQAIDGHAGGQQQAQLAQQRSAVQLAREQRVHHLPHLARQPDDEHRDAEQHQRPTRHRRANGGRRSHRSGGTATWGVRWPALGACGRGGTGARMPRWVQQRQLAERLPDGRRDSRVASRGFGGLARLEGSPEPPLRRACWREGVGSPSSRLCTTGREWASQPAAGPPRRDRGRRGDRRLTGGTPEVGIGRAAVFRNDSGAGEPPLATACRRAKVPSRLTAAGQVLRPNVSRRSPCR